MNQQIRSEPRSAETPPRRGNQGLKIKLAILLAVIIFCLATFSFALYVAMTSGYDGPRPYPTGSFDSVESNNTTTALAVFGSISNNPEPVNLVIQLETDTTIARYSWNGNGDGEVLERNPIDVDLGSITYHDLENNEEVNEEDYLYISGLSPDSDYTIRLIWSPTGDAITWSSFSTPDG
ncbi:MAG: hypothetical protein ACW99U_18955 [Candidatus Thorarchaeota archaeon]|jgi:hypothetical protein